jgi:hypothetical protein
MRLAFGFFVDYLDAVESDEAAIATGQTVDAKASASLARLKQPSFRVGSRKKKPVHLLGSEGLPLIDTATRTILPRATRGQKTREAFVIVEGTAIQYASQPRRFRPMLLEALRGERA